MNQVCDDRRLSDLRGRTKCKPEDAASHGAMGFVSAGDLASVGGCKGPRKGFFAWFSAGPDPGHFQWQPELLGPYCPLFARKFPPDTATAVLALGTAGKSPGNWESALANATS